MNKMRSLISNSSGMSLIELIMTLAILGILITPVMSMFVFSAKINMAARNEFKTGMLAQSYMEEIKGMEELDEQKYVYNAGTGKYERHVPQTESNYGAEITIKKGEGIIYLIDISIINDGEIVKDFEGSKIFGE